MLNLNSKSWRKCSHWRRYFYHGLSVRGNQVKLGVQAPKEVSVHREEFTNEFCSQKDEHDR